MRPRHFIFTAPRQASPLPCPTARPSPQRQNPSSPRATPPPAGAALARAILFNTPSSPLPLILPPRRSLPPLAAPCHILPHSNAFVSVIRSGERALSEHLTERERRGLGAAQSCETPQPSQKIRADDGYGPRPLISSDDAWRRPRPARCFPHSSWRTPAGGRT